MPLPDARVITAETSIELAGRLDLSCAGALYDDVLAILAHARPARIVIDLQRVTTADSTAFGMLVLCQRAAVAAGTAIALVNPSPPIRLALWASGLCGLFGLAADLPPVGSA